MAFVLVRFAHAIESAIVIKRLTHFKWFTSLGESHERRLRSANEVGLSQDSAPVQSIKADLLNRGASERVSINLSHLNLALLGQLGETGLLISCRDLSPQLVANDCNVIEFIATLRSLDPESSVEIG